MAGRRKREGKGAHFPTGSALLHRWLHVGRPFGAQAKRPALTYPARRPHAPVAAAWASEGQGEWHDRRATTDLGSVVFLIPHTTEPRASQSWHGSTSIADTAHLDCTLRSWRGLQGAASPMHSGIDVAQHEPWTPREHPPALRGRSLVLEGRAFLREGEGPSGLKSPLLSIPHFPRIGGGAATVLFRRIAPGEAASEAGGEVKGLTNF